MPWRFGREPRCERVRHRGILRGRKCGSYCCDDDGGNFLRRTPGRNFGADGDAAVQHRKIPARVD